MSTFLQQLPALIGVVVGALGSFIVVTATERARFQREQTARWDDRRVNAYAEYARALKESIILSQRIVAKDGHDPHPHPLSRDDGLTALASVVPRREAAWESVLLVGMSDAIEAARRWHKLVWQMERFARDQIRDPERWRELWEKSDSLRADFYRTARRDLGIKSVDR